MPTNSQVTKVTKVTQIVNPQFKTPIIRDDTDIDEIIEVPKPVHLNIIQTPIKPKKSKKSCSK